MGLPVCVAGYCRNSHTHTILSMSEMHLSMYSCSNRITSPVTHTVLSMSSCSNRITSPVTHTVLSVCNSSNRITSVTVSVSFSDDRVVPVHGPFGHRDGGQVHICPEGAGILGGMGTSVLCYSNVCVVLCTFSCVDSS